MSYPESEKFEVDCNLADEYLQTGHCPHCQINSMSYWYDQKHTLPVLLCGVCGLNIPLPAIAHMMYIVEQFEHIVPAWVDDDDILDSWVF